MNTILLEMQHPVYFTVVWVALCIQNSHQRNTLIFTQHMNLILDRPTWAESRYKSYIHLNHVLMQTNYYTIYMHAHMVFILWTTWWVIRKILKYNWRLLILFFSEGGGSNSLSKLNAEKEKKNTLKYYVKTFC
jgi:hypothetical protein